MSIIQINNPFAPDTDQVTYPLEKDISISEWIEHHPHITTQPTVCIVNSQVLLRKSWSTTIITKSDEVVFYRLPLGGGGGKNPLLFLLGIATIVTGAIFLTGLLLYTTVAVGSILAVIGGGLLSVPAIPSTDAQAQISQPSPTYSLSAQGNYARVGSAVPVVYGRTKIYPDFIERPWSNFVDGEQFLYHLLCIGQGQCNVELNSIKIEDTSIQNFKEISFSIYPPNAPIALFPSNVATAIEVAGQELPGINSDVYSAKPAYVWGFPIQVRGDSFTLVLDVDIIVIGGLNDYTDATKSTFADFDSKLVFEYRRFRNNGLYNEPLNDWTVFHTENISSTKSPSDLIIRNKRLTGVYPIGRNEIVLVDVYRAGKRPRFGEDPLIAVNIKNAEIWYSEIVDAEDGRKDVAYWFPVDTLRLNNPLGESGRKDANDFRPRETSLPLFNTWLPREELTRNTVGIPQRDDDDLSVGWFTITPKGEATYKIELDFICDRGLYKLDNNGNIQENQVDLEITYRFKASSSVTRKTLLLEQPPPGTKEQLTLKAKSNSPYRYTHTINTSARPGEYEVKVRRTSYESTDNKVVDHVVWSGAKAFNNPITYKDITVMAVRMQATNNLSSTNSRKINCIVTRKIPGLLQSSVDERKTTACDAIIDMLTSKQYGAGLDKSRIVMSDFEESNRRLINNKETFNGVFDRTMSLWEAIGLVARCVRSTVIVQGGQIRLIRDVAKYIPVIMFTPRNIIRDSLTISYSMATENTADGVTLEYLDEAKGWLPQEVTVVAEDDVHRRDNIRTPQSPVKLQLFGCTNYQQARAEAIYIARNNKYRRTELSFTTEMEGYIPTYGDTILVSHTMTNWGISGDVIGVKDNGEIVLSEPCKFEDGKSHFIYFRGVRGDSNGEPAPVSRGVDDYHVRLSDRVLIRKDNSTAVFAGRPELYYSGIYLYYGDAKEATHFAFGVGKDWIKKAIVKSIRPSSQGQVQINAVIDNEKVYKDLI